MVIVATLLGAGVVQLSKRMVLSFHSLSVITLTAVLACPVFLVGALLWGHPEQMWRGPAAPAVIMLVSGAYGLMIGGALYYFCLHKFGMVLTLIAGLAAPVFTGIWGYLLFRETMSPREMAAAAVLLLGCYLVVGGKRESAPPLSEAVEG
jgi:drug/metabolite transporter (DMT)-like permease